MVDDPSKITVKQFLAGEVRRRPKKTDAFRIVERDVSRNLGISFEEMRGKLKISKAAFSKSIGLTYEQYVRIMGGRATMKVSNLILISRLTGYSLMRLLRLKESGYFEDMVE